MHRTIEAAEVCCARDHAAISRLNSSGSLTRAYSDRKVVPADDEARKEFTRLSEIEGAEMDRKQWGDE